MVQLAYEKELARPRESTPAAPVPWTFMIDKFVQRFMSAEDALRAKLRDYHDTNYKGLVELVVGVLSDEDEYDSPDPKRIHEIDDGDYQGALVYVIGANGYQPSTYWVVTVSYGSCSGCDTLQAILNYSEEPNSDEQVRGLWTLCLHIVQGLKEI